VWTKTSDDFPECMFDLSDAAYRLHHAATTYCNRLLTDGRIAKARLSLVPVPEKVRKPSIVRELIAAGLWVDGGDHWMLADFLVSQPTRDEVEATRDYNAIRQRIRYAKGDPAKQLSLRVDEAVAKERVNRTKEDRRAVLSRRSSQGDVGTPSQRESHRPDPPRPAPSLDEGEDGTETSRRDIVGAPQRRSFADEMKTGGLDFAGLGFGPPAFDRRIEPRLDGSG